MNNYQKGILIVLYLFTQLSIVPLMYSSKKVTRCGTVVDKKQPTTMDLHKHSADIRIEDYLYVDYDGYTAKEAVDANTFYKYNKGDRICFVSEVNTFHGAFVGILCLALLLGVMIDFVILIFGLIILWKLIGGKSLKEIMSDED